MVLLSTIGCISRDDVSCSQLEMLSITLSRIDRNPGTSVPPNHEVFPRGVVTDRKEKPALVFITLYKRSLDGRRW